jgi:lycopene beta-cyclase
MSSTIFDFAIVGAGAAGLQLALAMNKDHFFQTRKIIILDKSAKNANDKTWCFWERGKGPYDSRCN